MSSSSPSLTVMTAAEFKARVREGRTPGADEVDIVTCATFGVMSGTTAVLSVPVAEPGAFLRADSLTINGVPTFPGPCPNERLGVVETTLYATARRDARYGGGHLLHDLLAEDEVEVVATAGGRTFENMVALEDLPFARLVTTRSAFKNYQAFVNQGEETEKTIFAAGDGLAGGFTEASVSGCGEINPLENDPLLRHLRTGVSLLLAGGEGYIMGEGSGSTPKKPNLALYGDLAGMDPAFLRGIVTSAGPECMLGVAAAIPVHDDADIATLSVLDENIPLTVADIRTRAPIAAEATYGDVWQGTGRRVAADPFACLFCGECPAGMNCPTGAVMPGGGVISDRCTGCGACLSTCPGGVFSMETGTLPVGGRDVPITLRQSDRAGAERLCELLREMIERGEFHAGAGV